MSSPTADYHDDQPSGADRAMRAISLGGAALLLFLGGVAVSIFGVFPAPLLHDAYVGGRALYDKWTQYGDITRTDLWNTARTDARGVTVYDSARVQPGYKLYSSGHEATAYLMKPDGEVVHQWHRPYSTVWTQDSGVVDPLPDANVYFRRMWPFPNGDLLTIYEGAGDTPYGYGMVKLDRDSNVIWSYFGRAHHDFDVAADGRIYALTHENRHKVIEGFEHLAATRLDDYLDVLSPDGTLEKRVSLLEAVAGSPFSHLVHTVPVHSVADPLHVNTVKVLTPDMAQSIPGTEAGQVLLSLRNIGAVIVVDLERETVVWALRGPWYGQHDPDILPNGNMLIFDNVGNFMMPGGKSRILEVDPRTVEIVWSYVGTEDRPFDTDIRADQQRLANGNTLINESNGGRLFEVTPAGEVVWEYVNPVRRGDSDEWIPIVASTSHVALDFFDTDLF